MKKLALLLTITSLPSLLSGCGLIISADIVPGQDISTRAGLPRLDPNSPACPFSIETDANGIKHVTWLEESRIHIDPNDDGFMKYHKAFVSFSQTGIPVVEGKINGRYECGVALDTGASPEALLFTQGHVLRHRMPVYPLGDSVMWAICQAPEIRFGNAALTGFPGAVLKMRTRLKVFGVPVGDIDVVAVPLPALSKFKFMEISAEKEYALLSADKSFEPDDPMLWSQYAMAIADDNFGQQLFVTMPIGGEEMRVEFDTCSSGCLDVSEAGWERLAARLADYRILQGSSHYVAYSRYKHQSARIKRLQVGDRVVRNIEIDIRPADSDLPVVEGDGLLGMGFFRDTTIVLDFERNILWVRNEDAD